MEEITKEPDDNIENIDNKVEKTEKTEITETSISVKTLPGKTDYFTGEKLNLEKLEVLVHKSNGDEVSVTEYKTEPASGTVLKKGNTNNQSVKIIYNNLTASFDINVYDTFVKFTEQPVNKQYNLYEENQKLTAKIKLDEDAVVNLILFRKNPDEKEFVQIGETEAAEVKAGKIWTCEINLPVNHYVKSQYYFRANAVKGTAAIGVDSDVVDVEQIIETGLPLLKIETKDRKEINSREEYISASFNMESVNFDNVKLEKIGIKGRGNTSWTMPKKSYTLKFEDKKKVLGMGESKKWVLLANYSDKSLLRNWYAGYLKNNVLKSEEWSPSFESVDLVLNNEYLGTYLLGEQIKIEKKRVNITSVADIVKGKVKNDNGDIETDISKGGFILEVDARKDAEYWFYSDKDYPFCLKDPDVDDYKTQKSEVESYIKSVVQNAEKALYSQDWLDKDKGYTKYIDVDSFIDWYLVNEIAKNNDSCWFTSVYLYFNPKDGLLHMGPVWDFDIGFGNVNYNNCDKYEGFWCKDSGWHKRLFEDPEFVAKVKERWELMSSNSSILINIISEEADKLSCSANLNFVRWNILGYYVWPNPEGYEQRLSYSDEVNYFIDWFTNRSRWLDTQIKAL